MKQNLRYPTTLTVAGSDSGGGAGIQADLKTFSALGTYGASVVTSVTVQNTRKVYAVESLPATLVQAQLDAVLQDIKVDAVKTGMLTTPQIVETVAFAIDKYSLHNVVIDPVLVATSGDRLASAAVVDSFRSLLFDRLSILTPNIKEAEVLSGITIKNKSDCYRAGEYFLTNGCKAVLVKGGHLTGKYAEDIFFTQNNPPEVFSSVFIESSNLHGTGCSLASAIAAFLALGHGLRDAVKLSKEFITSAIETGKAVKTGSGNGPLNHFFDPQPLKPIYNEDNSER